jgi:hypothetical protein
VIEVKKLIIFTFCMFITSMILSFIVLPSISKAVQAPTAVNTEVSSQIVSNAYGNSKPESDISGADVSSRAAKYIVKAYNGIVAVFKVNNEYPFKVLDVSVESLPYADQDMLNKGIYVADDQELNSILEDYGS